MELIAAGDFLNIGRIAINNWYSGGTVNIWTAGTGTNSVRLTAGNSTASGIFGLSAGKNNSNSGGYGTIVNGTGNTVSNSFGFVGNGKLNNVATVYGFIGNGSSNAITGSGSRGIIVGGKSNGVTGSYGLIVGGLNNSAQSTLSAIISGNGNIVRGTFGFIGNGAVNTISNSTQSGFIGNGGQNNLTATNSPAILAGFNNAVSGNYSVILNGLNNTVSGDYAMAFGTNCVASHDFSIAIDKTAVSNSTYQMVFANGSSGNSIRLKYLDGTGSFEGGVNTGPADYAEYFEWADGNPNGEKRFGYAVSIVEDGKIEIGGLNPIGIVSPTPAIVGDSAELTWKEKYLTDEWGIKLTEEFKKFYSKELKSQVYVDKYDNHLTDISGTLEQRLTKRILQNIEIPAEYSTIEVPKLNPAFTGVENYTPRSQRKEWVAIGLIGKLRIKTSEKIKGKFIDINDKGVAVSGTKYHVLQTIKEFDGKEGIVLVFFK